MPLLNFLFHIYRPDKNTFLAFFIASFGFWLFYLTVINIFIGYREKYVRREFASPVFKMLKSRRLILYRFFWQRIFICISQSTSNYLTVKYTRPLSYNVTQIISTEIKIAVIKKKRSLVINQTKILLEVIKILPQNVLRFNTDSSNSIFNRSQGK